MSEYNILINLEPTRDLNAKVTGLNESASISFYENSDDCYDEEGPFYETPCLVFREYDEKISLSVGTFLLKDVLCINLDKSDVKRAESFFKKYGLKVQ